MTDLQQSQSTAQWLANLPEREPPEGLWTRVLETRLHQQQRRLRQRSVIAVAAGALCLVLAVAVVLRPPPGAAGEDRPQVKTLVQQTGLMERALQEQANRFSQLARERQQLIVAQQAQLVALDRALASAYQRHESSVRLAQLWQRRLDLMTGLVDLYAPAARERT